MRAMTILLLFRVKVNLLSIIYAFVKIIVSIANVSGKITVLTGR